MEVCVELKSGDIAGRSISIDYNTLEGSAVGTNKLCFIKRYNYILLLMLMIDGI